jgi:hypothetical protein
MKKALKSGDGLRLIPLFLEEIKEANNVDIF